MRARLLFAPFLVPSLVLVAACVDRGDVGAFGDHTSDEAGATPGTVNLTRATTPLAASGATTCALRASGGVACWGSNAHGELGAGDTPRSSAKPLVPVRLETGVRALAGGLWAQCALLENAELWCWGDALFQKNSAGESANLYVTEPFPVKGFSSDVAQVTVGLEYACALLTDGRAKCWGLNSAGQLGNGGSGDNAVPADVVGGAEPLLAIAASVGGAFTCGLTASHRVACWGANDERQLGVEGPGTNKIGVTVAGVESAVSVTLGATHACALTTDAKVLCWGGAGWAQVGRKAKSSAPVEVALPPAKAVAAGADHTCAITNDGAVFCWGRNDIGQIVTPESESIAPREIVPASFGATSVSCGVDHCCAMTDARTVRCWGNSSNEQLGAGTFSL